MNTRRDVRGKINKYHQYIKIEYQNKSQCPKNILNIDEEISSRAEIEGVKGK